MLYIIELIKKNRIQSKRENCLGFIQSFFLNYLLRNHDRSRKCCINTNKFPAPLRLENKQIFSRKNVVIERHKKINK